MAKKTVKNFDDIVGGDFGELYVSVDKTNEAESIKAISTSSLSLDVSTGIGGIPLGRFTELYGPEGSGKTTLALEICNNAIKLGHRVNYLDPENTLDLDYARTIIENLNNEVFTLVQPETMEETLTIAEYAIKEGNFNLIVLDSIGSLAPQKVKDDDLTDANVALLSRLLTTFLQRNAYGVRKSNLAFLGINQVRDKIGAYMATYETPGGHAWKHITSLRIQLSKGIDIEQGDEKIGINTRFVIKKNKLAPPNRAYTVPIIYGEGVDTLRDVISFANMLGILEKGGPYYKFEGNTLASGVNGTMEYLRNNPEILDKIVKACYNSVNSKSIREEIEE
jgi:recombination protein RecA